MAKDKIIIFIKMNEKLCLPSPRPLSNTLAAHDNKKVPKSRHDVRKNEVLVSHPLFQNQSRIVN